MRRLIVTLIFAVTLLSSAAQDGDYPTLAALENLETPAFDFADMAGRMSRVNPRFDPPSQPPAYQLGDRERFWLHYGAEHELEYFELELRAQTERVLIWVELDADFPRWRAQALAKRVAQEVLHPMRKLFGLAEPPGVDGDPRLTIALVHDSEEPYGGYFSRADTLPRRLDPYSNQREMLVANLGRDDEYDFYDDILIDIIAHEYLHILHHHSDFGEELWLDEAIATFAAFRATQPLLSRSVGHVIADSFLETPAVGLTHWRLAAETQPKYGAGFLFTTYLAQRFGDEIVAALLADPSDGWASVVKVLDERAGASANEVFADWTLANFFLDSRRGYGYRGLDSELTRPQPIAALNSFPATFKSELPQYSADYISVNAIGADKLHLRLAQDDEARLAAARRQEGEYFFYAVPGDHANPRLTRALNLDTTSRVWLEYRLWHDLDPGAEYLYITLSADGGESWKTLEGRHTEASRVYEDYYDHGYTGQSGYWLQEVIELSDYAPGEVWIRLELISVLGTTYGGAAIDSLRVRAISLHDGFEVADDAWIAEGWIRADNRLPRLAWLQAAQETAAGLEITRELLTGPGEMTVDLAPGTERVLVAVSPITPYTALPTKYRLDVNLLDAEGAALSFRRDCPATTTAGLNFRDAPNGEKIGLLPQGATAYALAREGDWLRVEYRGDFGWVHAGYARLDGDCP